MPLQPTQATGRPNQALKPNGTWYESMLGIMYVVDDTVQFSDDWSHWHNGFCRLLEISEDKAKEFVESTVAAGTEKFGKLPKNLTYDERLICLTSAVDRTLYGGERKSSGKPQASWGTDLLGAHADTVYAHSISGNKSRIVAGNSKHEYAWLVDPATNKAVDANSIVYDTTYFSAGGEAHYGPKEFLQQVDWRLEKATRLVRTVMNNCGNKQEKWLAKPQDVKVLDLGSASGYFRKAFSEYDFQTYGTEFSPEVIELCKQRFGFETWKGGIAQLSSVASGMKFQIITLWDVIEHLGDVVESIKLVRDYLSEDGILVVRTPNLMALETDILGDYYYSFKLDHILYFSPHSLNNMMDGIGLKPLYMDTDSHLFNGILGADSMFKLGRALKGADIMSVYGLE